MTDYTFKRNERLKSKKTIDRLFSEGQSFGVYPVRVIWVEVAEPLPYPIQCSVSVAKKKFPKAVHRNRIKRQLREAWRLNKASLYEQLPEGKYYGMMLLFTAKDFFEQAAVEQSVQRIIKKFLKRINQPS